MRHQAFDWQAGRHPPVANGRDLATNWGGLRANSMRSLSIFPLYNMRRFADFVTELLQFVSENIRIILPSIEKKYFPKFSSGAVDARGETLGAGLSGQA